MARYGIPLEAAQNALAAAVSGEEAAEVAEGNSTTDVVVLYPPELRSSAAELGAITVDGAGGARIRIVLPISILMIGLLLYSSLTSWVLALIVLLNLPFAAVGGVAALWLRGLHLSVSAAIGFIALVGVAVLNGLVLLTTIQHEHDAEGVEAHHAAAEGRGPACVPYS